ncbi:MAG TPA: hypothetical protein VMV29_04630 [Ktedonobacterales bacterium]|nr:hypothetical protein [Ktedonobacterales bacterium]
MSIQLATVKAVIAEAQMRAETLAATGSLYAATPIYEMALSSVNTFLLASEATQTGWLGAVALLTDMRHRLSIDALGATPAEQLEARVRCLLDLQELSGVEALEDLHDAIANAIAVGAPRYNAGDIRGCCTMYWTTIQAMIFAPVRRGFAGYARTMAQLKAVVEADPPPAPLDSRGVDTFAWDLRYAFDAALRVTG